MEENYEIKPEIKKEIEQIMRQDEGVQEYVEKLKQKKE